VAAGGMAAGLAAGAALAAYGLLLRPWHTRWGTTDAEAEAPLPGDALFSDRPTVSTRAVTIAAPPRAVWPWLVQIGQGRGGFYSYDRLENLFGLRIHSADRIEPEHQTLAVGDFIASAPEHWEAGPDGERPGWHVAAVEPPRLLALDGWGTFVLRPLPGNRTRLLVRTRPEASDGLLSRLSNYLLLEPAHFVMERKMLLGIKERAETAYRSSRPSTTRSDSAMTDAIAPWSVDADAFPADGTDAEKLHFLVRYAVLAPSGHNTQPWRFRVTDTTVELWADRSRALPVVDPDDRALVISCGAALLHLRLAARHFGYAGMVHRLPDPAEPDLLARFQLGAPHASTPEEDALFDAIPERRTTRRPFESDPIPLSTLDALVAAAVTEGAWLEVVTKPEQKEEIATLVAQGDRAQMADPAFRDELAAWIRREGGDTGDGLTGYAFGVPKALDLATPAFAAAVRYIDMGEQQAAKDRALTEAAPALVVLGTAADEPLAWLRTGEALARVLLRARANGIVAAFLNQPIEVQPLRPRLRAALGREDYPQILVRIGRGPEIDPAPRRPPEEVTEDA